MHKFQRQGLVESKICRYYRIEAEEDASHMLFCSNKNFWRFREEAINNLQLQVISLSKRDLSLLCSLDNILNSKFSELEDALEVINRDLNQFRLKNLWHGFISTSLLD